MLGRHSERFLEALRAQRYSPKSLQLYRQALMNFDSYLWDRDITSVTVEDLEHYRGQLIDRDFRPASVDVYLRTVRRLFGWLTEEHVLFDNPAAQLLIPRTPRQLLPVPTENEMARLLNGIDISTAHGVRDRAIIETTYATGVRRAELIALTHFDVDLDAETLRIVGKGNKERVVPLGKHAVQWLREYLKGARRKLIAEGLQTEALWIGRHGRELSYESLAQMIKRHALNAGLKRIGPHAIRRACATHMLRAGAHPVQLQMLLGHSSLKTLSQYLRVSITDLQQAHAQQNPGR